MKEREAHSNKLVGLDEPNQVWHETTVPDVSVAYSRTDQDNKIAATYHDHTTGEKTTIYFTVLTPEAEKRLDRIIQEA